MTDSPHLVLLHGALGGSSQFVALADALRPHFRVHPLDFEGHASSPPRERPHRISHFIENVLDLLDSNGVDEAHLFGHSLGGYVALCFALEHPTRVAKVATLGTKFRWDPNAATREAARLDPASIRAKVPRYADALEARHATAGGWEGVLARTAEFLRHLGDHLVLTDATLGMIGQPVRVIVGDRDVTVGVDESAAVARALRNGSLTVMPDTPHPLEQVSVERLAPVLLDFYR